MLFVSLIDSHANLLADDGNFGEGRLFLYPCLFNEVTEVLGGTIDIRHLVVDFYEDVGYSVDGKNSHQMFDSTYLLPAVIQRGGVGREGLQ